MRYKCIVPDCDREQTDHSAVCAWHFALEMLVFTAGAAVVMYAVIRLMFATFHIKPQVLRVASWCADSSLVQASTSIIEFKAPRDHAFATPTNDTRVSQPCRTIWLN